MSTDKALDDITVLDLTTSKGEIAGRILADLGAEVLKVEPPSGVDSRSLPPFDAEGNSLFWASYGLGKQSLVIDLETKVGRGELWDLAAHSH